MTEKQLLILNNKDWVKELKPGDVVLEVDRHGATKQTIRKVLKQYVEIDHGQYVNTYNFSGGLRTSISFPYGWIMPFDENNKNYIKTTIETKKRIVKQMLEKREQTGNQLDRILEILEEINE